MADLTFDEAMILTRTISSHAAFEDAECAAYFNVLMGLPSGSQIVEVGVEYGRSSSIALQVAKAHDLHYQGIDSFVDPAALVAFFKLFDTVGARHSRIFEGMSSAYQVQEPIDAILIDGDHTYAGVTHDATKFLPWVVEGGYVMFHDFGRDSLPEVYAAITDYMAVHREWEQVEVVGTLGVWRRV